MLILKNVYKKYKEKVILNNYNYCFEKGIIYFLCAGSGKGKTTLLNIISQNDKNYYGNVIYDNKKVEFDENFCLEKISYIYQDFSLFEELSVIDNINIFDYNINDLQLYAKRLKINHILHQKVKYLSGGEKQRVNILRALLKNSEIILADEPTSSLNDSLSKEVYEILKEIKKDKIIIVVTHQMKFVKKYADILFSLNEFNKVDVFYENKQQLKSNNINKINYKRYKKIYQTHRLFSYLTYMVMFLGLYITGLSFLINNTLNVLIDNQFSMLDYSNYITIKADNKNLSENLNIDLDIEYRIEDNKIITPYPEMLLQYLLNDDKYLYYNFQLKNQEIIFAKKETSRISFKSILEFANKNKFKDCIYGDNQNIFIDYQSGSVFLLGIDKLEFQENVLEINKVEQIIKFNFYENDLLGNEVALSTKLANKLNIKILEQLTFYVGNKKINYIVKEIVDENMFDCIYAHGNFMNNFCESRVMNIYNGLYKVENKNNIAYVEGLKYNRNLFSVQDYDFTSEVTELIFIYSLILVLFSFLVVMFNFNIMLLKNKKHTLILNRLGLSKCQQKILLFTKPFMQLIKVSALTFIQLLITNFLLKIFIKENLNMHIDFSFPFLSVFIIIFFFVLSFGLYFYGKTNNIIKNL